MPKLIDQYGMVEVRHADDTSWRTDGRSCYAWPFATETLSVFLFCSTRSDSVAREFLGTQPLPGVLAVDRYNRYNRAPCKLQYRYAHLLREVEDLAREASDRREVTAVTATIIPLLAQTPCN